MSVGGSAVAGSESSRVAIVTGGSGGIGRTVAERLAADGMKVVIGYAGNPARAQEAVKAITAAGGTAVAVRADVADEAEVAALFDRAEQPSAVSTSSCTPPGSCCCRRWSTSTSPTSTGCTAPTCAAPS